MPQQAYSGTSLSWGDAFFLYLEREGQPLNIASVCEFEGDIPLQACMDFVASKLPLLPRYTQRVVAPAFHVGLPTWEADPAFDLRNHVREVRLQDGTDAEVKALAGTLVGQRQDRMHPLWDMTLVRGLKSKRTCVVFRIHHCLADGVSGVGLMNVLMDASANPPKRSRRRRGGEPPVRPRPDAGAMVLDGLVKTYSSLLQAALAAPSEVLNLVQEVIASAGQGKMAELLQLVPELATPAERLPFNQVCRGPQRVAWADIPLAEIKAVRQKVCGTVNDVILTVMTMALRRYAERRGSKLRGRQLRVVVPVNVRGEGDVSELGNRITFLPINIPLDVNDPRRLLAIVSERMMLLRRVGVAELVGLVGTVVSRIPLPVQALLAPLASQLPLSLCNTICTNVPGPQFPLYLMGHKMVRWYPYVPIGGEMGINSAIISYDGVVYFGYSGDVPAAPELGRLEKFTVQSFAGLKRAAGVKRAARAARPRAGFEAAPASARAARAQAPQESQVGLRAGNHRVPKQPAGSSVSKGRPKRHATAAAAFAPFPPAPEVNPSFGPQAEPALPAVTD
jgi:WS/DGAT/MGAT family acyltransferase